MTKKTHGVCLASSRRHGCRFSGVGRPRLRGVRVVDSPRRSGAQAALVGKRAGQLGSDSMNVLAIGAHPDDVELGCGGALARHVAAGDKVTFLVMTTGERGPQDSVPRVLEQEAAAAR